MRNYRSGLVNKKILVDAIGVLLIALVVVMGYKLSPLLLPKIDVIVQPGPGCELQKAPCEASLPGGGSLHFGITPRPIPMVSPLQLDVSITGQEATKVEVDFTGANMNMGLNRPRLVALGDGHFNGQGTLPVCVTGGMDWQATVLVETGRERIAIPFRFTSGQG